MSATIPLEDWLKSGKVTFSEIKVVKLEGSRKFALTAFCEEVQGWINIKTGTRTSMEADLTSMIVGALNDN